MLLFFKKKSFYYYFYQLYYCVNQELMVSAGTTAPRQINLSPDVEM